MLIKLSLIKAHPQNRSEDAHDEFTELLENIRQRIAQGLSPLRITPIVRKVDKGYQILSGHRRIRACRELGLESVECEVRSMDKLAALEFVLEDNLHRRNYMGVEMLDLVKKFKASGLKTQDVAAKLGCTTSYVRRIASAKIPEAQMVIARTEGWSLNRLLTLVKASTPLDRTQAESFTKRSMDSLEIMPVSPWRAKRKLVSGVKCWSVSVCLPLAVRGSEIAAWIKHNAPDALEVVDDQTA